MGVIEGINKNHARVRWCFPVWYHDRYVTVSGFCLDNFSNASASTISGT